MPAHIFGIIADEKSRDHIAQSIESKYSSFHEVDDRFFLVAIEAESQEDAQKAALGQQVIDNLQLGDPLPDEEDEKITGIVFSLNGLLGGYYKIALWEWARDHRG